MREVSTCAYWTTSPNRYAIEQETLVDPYSRNPASLQCRYDEFNAVPPDILNAIHDNNDLAAIEDFISCFNNGACDGFGTCLGCSKYSTMLGLNAAILNNITEGFPLQLPLNFQAFNLQASMQKCCHWLRPADRFYLREAPDGLVFEANEINGPIKTEEVSGIVIAGWEANTSPSFIIDPRTGITRYLVEGYSNYDGENDLVTGCGLWELTLDWSTASDITDQYGTQPCNGSRTDCPFFTGPKWQYATQELLGAGQYITAKQLLELRYYADNWKRYEDPLSVYRRRYRIPDIWAWGETQWIEEGEPDVNGNYPVVLALSKVHISNFDTGQISVESDVVAGGGSDDTAGNEHAGAPDYPTLIHELNSAVEYVRILHPISGNTGPYTYRHFTKDKNYIDIILRAPANSTLYVVNFNYVKPPFIPRDAADFDVIGPKKQQQLQSFFSGDEFDYYYKSRTRYGGPAITYFNSRLSSEFIHLSISDGRGIKLDYNTTNRIAVFCLTSAGTWSYDYTDVRFEFLHAFPAQTSFTGGSAGDIGTDIAINNLQVSGEMKTLGSLTLNNLVHIHNSDSNYQDFVLEQAVIGEVINNWVPLACGKILVTLDDLNISRVVPYRLQQKGINYQWKIDEVTITNNTRVVAGLPTVSDYQLYYRNTDGFGLPANCAILEPVDDNFFAPVPGDTVRMNYTYYKTLQAPNYGDAPYYELGPEGSPMNIVSELLVSKSFGNRTFEISQEIGLTTLLFEANFADSDGRLIGKKMFKPIVQVKENFCRDIEIEYRWSAPVQTMVFYPDNSRMVGEDGDPGFRIEAAGPPQPTLFIPNCGDHDKSRKQLYSSNGETGPMFYPYSACAPGAFQIIGDENFQVVIYPIPGKTLTDERFHSVDRSVPRTLAQHHVIWDCGLDHTFGNDIVVGDDEFVGIAIARGIIYSDALLMYKAMGWQTPLFGNLGRELSRVFLSVDRDTCGTGDYSANRWLPAVLTYPSTDLVSNVFSESYYSPFNLLVCNTIGGSDVSEAVIYNSRYIYEDLFEKVFSAGESVKPLANYYYVFKVPNVIWAWRESDLPVSRDTNFENVLPDMDYFLPDYILPGYFATEGGVPTTVVAKYPYGWESTGAIQTIDGTDYWVISGKEIRTRPVEGEHIVSFIPPRYDASGVNLIDETGFRLNNGPIREIDFSTGEIKENGLYSEMPYDYVTTNGGNAIEGRWSLLDTDGQSYIYLRTHRLEPDGESYKHYYDFSTFPSSSLESIFDGNINFTFNLSVAPEGAVVGKDLTIVGDFSGIAGVEYAKDYIPLFTNSNKTLLLTQLGCSGVSTKDKYNTEVDAFLGTFNLDITLSRPAMLDKLNIDYFVGDEYSVVFPGATIYAKTELNPTFVTIGSFSFDTSKSLNYVFSTQSFRDVSGEKYTAIRIAFASRSAGQSMLINRVQMFHKELQAFDEVIGTTERKYYISTGATGDADYMYKPGEEHAQIAEHGATFELVRPEEGYAALSKTRAEQADELHADKDDYRDDENLGALENWQGEVFQRASSFLSGGSSFSSYFPPDAVDFIQNELHARVPFWTLNLTSASEDIRAYGTISPGEAWGYPGYTMCYKELQKYQCTIGGDLDDMVFNYGFMPYAGNSMPKCDSNAGEIMDLGFMALTYSNLGGLAPTFE